MKQEFEQGFRMYYIRSDLNQVDVDQLDDADRERIETARDLLEAVSLLTRPADGAKGTSTQTPNWVADHAQSGTSHVGLSPRQGCGATP